jgi:hypothetical protein
MRLNIRDIIKATNCNEENAHEIERRINDQWLIDWSEATTAQIHKAARQVDAEWAEEDAFDGRA